MRTRTTPGGRCLDTAAITLCAGLAASAGTAVAGGSPPATPERMDDDVIRLIEYQALDGPVRTALAPTIPANRARLSRITVHDRGVRTAGSIDALSVIDSDPNTGVTLSGVAGSTVEASFIGAPRWISQVRVVTDADSVLIEALGMNGKWFDFGAGGQTIVGEQVRVSALRVVPLASTRGDGAVTISELDVAFVQHDPDDGTTYGLGSAAVAEFFYEWCETYASSPLSVCSEECEGLRDELRDEGWSAWGFGNNSSWEEDFKRSASGGTENSYVDSKDLCYFAGHGSSSYDSTWDRTARNLLFSRTDRDDSAHVPGDSYDSWGDVDMEWMCFAACQVLKDNGYWAASMDGQHLILGWHTNMRDVTMGIDFGKRTIGTSIFDPARKVLDSWLWAAEKHHGSGYTAKVIGETTSMGNDYLWGEGFVNPDPVDDSTYTLWTYNTGPGSVHERKGGGDRAPEPEDVLETGEIITLEGKGPRAVTVNVPEEILHRDRAGMPMKVYQLMPPQVHEGTVGAMADQLCELMGLFCGADVGTDRNGTEFIATDGPWELRVDGYWGAVELVNTEDFGTPFPDGKPPQLMDQGQAAELALGELQQFGLLPPDAQIRSVDSFIQGMGDEGIPREVAPHEYPPDPVHHRVVFGRTIDGFDVGGPAGEMVAFVGQNGLAQTQQNSWMAPEAIGEVIATSIDEILVALSEDPTRVAISGIPLVPESFDVFDAQLGYFSHVVPDAGGAIFLRPAWRILTTVTERSADPNGETQQSFLEINAWADGELPRVTIVGGPGGCVNYGEDVCFDSIVTGGTPPYNYSWKDPVSGVVSQSTKVCQVVSPVVDLPDDSGDQVRLPTEHETNEGSRSMELTVCDALGNIVTQTVSYPICQPNPCPADLNGDGILDNGDIQVFLQLFLSGNLGADMNGDGILDNGDIQTFISLFLAGC